jgi:hypothetical protein
MLRGAPLAPAQDKRECVVRPSPRKGAFSETLVGQRRNENYSKFQMAASPEAGQFD